MSHLGTGTDRDELRQEIISDLGAPQHEVEQDVLGRTLTKQERQALNVWGSNRGGMFVRDMLEQGRSAFPGWFFDENATVTRVNTRGPGINQGSSRLEIDRGQAQSVGQPEGSANGGPAVASVAVLGAIGFVLWVVFQ